MYDSGVYPPPQYGATGADFEPPAPYGYSPASMRLNGEIPQLEKKGTFVRGGRRRLNMMAVLISLFVPWLTFLITFYVLASPFHYNYRGPCIAILIIILVAILIQGKFAYSRRMQVGMRNAEREPSWMVFLFISLLVAYLTALASGTASYVTSTYLYHQVTSLNGYHGIDPTKMRGQQLLDAGTVDFTDASRLDITKSIGFRNSDVYCVAPVTVPGSGKQQTYDFWAVGINCCSGTKPDFHCPHFRNPKAHGGLRLMKSTERQYFRLAVQQAEAAYGIRAVHPIFFHWAEDPMAMLDKWKGEFLQNFLFAICGHFVFQTFIVVAATIAFSKLTG